MQSILTEKDSTAAWEQIEPLLDEAMGRLNEADRSALVLSFFENKTAQQVAATLKLSESTAHKRVSRALEKLRKYFAKRGVTLSVAFIAGAVAANSVQAAPAGLAATVAAAATKGVAVGGSTLALVKGTLKLMAWTKAKTTVGIGVAILLGGVGTATLVYHNFNNTPQRIAKQAKDAYAALSSYSDTGRVVVEGPSQSITTFSTRLQRPNLYRIDSTQTGEDFTNRVVAWSQGNGDFVVSEEFGQQQQSIPGKRNNMQNAFESVRAGSSSTSIPETFYKLGTGDFLPAQEFPLKKENDEKVNGVECNVLTYRLDADPKTDENRATITLWIAKHDHLIRQMRHTVEGVHLTLPYQSDANVRSILESQNKPATTEAVAAWRERTDLMFKQAEGKQMVFTTTLDSIVLSKKFAIDDFAREAGQTQ